MTEPRKRQSARELPRRIVRRTRPAVGQQRRIVRRKRDFKGGLVLEGSRWGSLFAWRPGKRATGVFAVVLTLVLLGGAGYAAYRSPLFEVSNVEVRGNTDVSTQAIIDRAALEGERMFNADLAAAQRAIYAIPLLSSVRLEREWPNTVVIHVEERQPWAVWEQGGVSYTIDREGVVIGTTPPPDGSAVIVSSEIGSRQLGERVDPHAVAVAADIYELLPERLGTTVTEVAFLTGKGVQVTTSDGQVALLGDSGGLNYKLAVWAQVSTTARGEGIDYSVIDLRYGNRPVLQ